MRRSYLPRGVAPSTPKYHGRLRLNAATMSVWYDAPLAPGIVSHPEPRPHPQRPDLVGAGVQDTEEIIVLAGKDNECVIGENTRVKPREQPILCHSGRGDKSFQAK